MTTRFTRSTIVAIAVTMKAADLAAVPSDVTGIVKARMDQMDRLGQIGKGTKSPR